MYGVFQVSLNKKETHRISFSLSLKINFLSAIAESPPLFSTKLSIFWYYFFFFFFFLIWTKRERKRKREREREREKREKEREKERKLDGWS